MLSGQLRQGKLPLIVLNLPDATHACERQPRKAQWSSKRTGGTVGARARASRACRIKRQTGEGTNQNGTEGACSVGMPAGQPHCVASVEPGAELPPAEHCVHAATNNTDFHASNANSKGSQHQ